MLFGLSLNSLERWSWCVFLVHFDVHHPLQQPCPHQSHRHSRGQNSHHSRILHVAMRVFSTRSVADCQVRSAFLDKLCELAYTYKTALVDSDLPPCQVSGWKWPMALVITAGILRFDRVKIEDGHFHPTDSFWAYSILWPLSSNSMCLQAGIIFIYQMLQQESIDECSKFCSVKGEKVCGHFHSLAGRGAFGLKPPPL